MKFEKVYQEILEELSQCPDTTTVHHLKEKLEMISIHYAKQNKRMQRILSLSDKQQMAILKLNEELDEYKNNLERKVEEEIEKRKAQEELLMEQSRLAAIAEMMDAVAHQWTQPLNLLSMYTYTLTLEAEKNRMVTPDSVRQFKENFTKQITHMSDTLNNFRSFFRPLDEKIDFKASDTVTSVLDLLRDDLLKQDIHISVDIEEELVITGNPNEFKHILINLISNAKYAFNEHRIQQKNITIRINSQTMKITDNAGGIPESLIDDIFKMNVTSKQGEGTGIGLYMSQQIAHKHNGCLSVENTKNGAEFTFTLHKERT
jgi:signal transduction histidine kinase